MGNPSRLASAVTKRFVAIRLFLTEAMIQVGNGDSKGIGGYECHQDMDEGHRIGTTGYADQNRISGLNHAMGAKGVINRSVYLFFDMEIVKTVASSGHETIVFGHFCGRF